MKKYLLFLLALIGLLLIIFTSVQGIQLPFTNRTGESTEISVTETVTSQPVLPTSTPSPTLSPTITPTATLPAPTSTPSLTATATWVFNEAGSVDAPILLYHHVNGETYNNRYEVSIEDFKKQMKTLYDMGYTTISTSEFLDALISGGELPAKPIMITFDDGNQSVFDVAFPIMKQYGFTGVVYIVANRIEDVPDFMNVKDLKKLIRAGWEVGSHSFTHTDITQNHDIATKEIAYSKIELEKALSTDVQTFAYPFGAIDPVVAKKVIDSGYRAAMGLGISTHHTLSTLYYLDRIEVYGSYTLDDFINLLSSN